MLWKLTPENYQKIRNFFPPASRRLTLLRFVYLFVSLPVYFVYPILLVLLWQGKDARFWPVLVVPAVAFAVCTVVRKLLNFPRPYDQPGFEPLMPKAMQGQSCPSRHAASVTIITLACWYVNPNLGAFLTVFAVLICVVRVVAGVHHPRDIYAGILLSLFIGFLGLWILTPLWMAG